MEIKYKEFSIIAAAEYENKSGLWNGRYRILDDKGVVAYESFVEPQSDQEEADDAAKKAAYTWIDAQIS